ncbi:MAG: DJ-1/PfpI family protein [Opitutales bacterium]|nr:DJ-1/PfpI family protein [Opitutales bacterium]
MTHNICFLFHDGMEELEAIAPLDILRRANLNVTTYSLGSQRMVTSRNGVLIQADQMFTSTLSPNEFEALVIPGGPGVKNLRNDVRVGALIRSFADAGKWVCAICAAPLLLHDQGLLEGIRYTAHVSTADTLERIDPKASVVVDGKIITSRGAGTSIDFGLTIVATLTGSETADAIAKAAEYPYWTP